MDKIFKIDSAKDFQKTIIEVIEYYCTKNLRNDTEHSSLIRKAKDELKNLLMNCKFETKSVFKVLIDTGVEEERIKFFETLLNKYKTQMLYATLILHNCEYGETVTGFDWCLKIVLGTSELNSLRYPLLQLIISSTDSNDSHKKNIYDVNKDMLLQLIHALEQLE